MLLVFDLDDTLYDEATFVESGFRAVADLLAPRVQAPADTLCERMLILLAQNGRGQVFDLLLAEHGIDQESVVAECVATYRNHPPRISLRPGVESMLASLASQGHRLYVVTDGDPAVQRRKFIALGLERLVIDILPTWEYGAPKPSLLCFDTIRVGEHAVWADVVYVGDDPSKDFVSLNEVGATTIRVETGRFAGVVAREGYDARLRTADVIGVPDVLGLLPAAAD